MDPVDRLHDHHGLGEVGIAGPLPEAVYGHLHLRGTGFDGGYRVCHGKAEVVVAVDVERAVDLAGEPAHEGFHARWRDNPDGVRDVDDRGPGRCCGLADLDQVVVIRPGRIHRREHAFVHMVSDVADDIAGDPEHLLPGLVDRVLPLDVRGRDEHVDHVDIAVDTGVHVGFHRAGEPADAGRQTQSFDRGNGLFLRRRRCREPCLDGMHADVRKLTGNLDLLFECEGNPRGLFPVTECRIKNGHVVLRTAIGEEDDPPQNPCE